MPQVSLYNLDNNLARKDTHFSPNGKVCTKPTFFRIRNQLLVRTGTISPIRMKKKKDTDRGNCLGLYLATASKRDFIQRWVTFLP